ncbi:MAG: VWA domain-containing protein [Bryobacteraceae bacterium]
MRTTILALWILTLSGAAAQTQPAETFKSGVTMIQVPVVVRDHDGHAVGNLTKDDFQLFDNGKRQEIASFSVDNGSQAAPDRSLSDGKPGAASAPGAAAVDIPSRFIAYLFDDLTIRDFGDLQHIRDAANRQIGELQPGDRTAIYTTSCTVALDFTNDRAKLQEAIAKLQLRPPAVCRVSRVEIVQVELLKAIIGKIASLPGHRDVILISTGFFIGHDRSFEETDLIDAAIRAKVAINAIDTGESTDMTGAGMGAATGRDTSRAPRYDNPTLPVELVNLAHGTGGTYLTGNDYAVSFRKLATPESHYVLGFVPAGKADGKFHNLKVKLENSHKVTVEARNGYFAAPKTE